LKIIKRAFTTFSNTRAAQAAAGLAYYAIFSLFPLLLVLIAGGSYFLNNGQVYQTVTSFILHTVPIPPQIINKNLKQVLDARGTVGIIGLLTLLWSASSFFTNLAHNINLAWSNAPRRNFLENRAVGLGMIAGLVGLLTLSVTLSWFASLIPVLNSSNASSPSFSLWRLISDFGSWLTTFLLFYAIYRWIPTVRVERKATLWGALFAAIAWKVATAGFGWYLSSGLSSYQLVYGSLGAIVALLFLIFILSLITLFGAHLSAAIDQPDDKKNKEH
jgi:membrane protein